MFQNSWEFLFRLRDMKRWGLLWKCGTLMLCGEGALTSGVTRDRKRRSWNSQAGGLGLSVRGVLARQGQHDQEDSARGAPLAPAMPGQHRTVKTRLSRTPVSRSDCRAGANGHRLRVAVSPRCVEAEMNISDSETAGSNPLAHNSFLPCAF